MKQVTPSLLALALVMSVSTLTAIAQVSAADLPACHGDVRSVDKLPRPN